MSVVKTLSTMATRSVSIAQLVYSSIGKEQDSQDFKYQEHHSVNTSLVTFFQKRKYNDKMKGSQTSHVQKVLCGVTSV